MAESVEKKKRARVRKWTERETVRFVELYEVEEILWNVRLNEYKNKDARLSALKRIVDNLNMPDVGVNEVLKKINNIRSTYQQEKVKIKTSRGTGSATEDVYVSTLPWFDIAERFLSEAINTRKTSSNLVSFINTISNVMSPLAVILNCSYLASRSYCSANQQSLL